MNAKLSPDQTNQIVVETRCSCGWCGVDKSSSTGFCIAEDVLSDVFSGKTVIVENGCVSDAVDKIVAMLDKKPTCFVIRGHEAGVVPVYTLNDERWLSILCGVQ